jgi:hypothetical protein
MSYGFEAKNDSGKVIINDEIENLHFLGKATLGYNNSAYGVFPDYSGPNSALDGRVIHTYTITSTGNPVAFIKPNDYSRWYAIIYQASVGNTWTFQVLVSGTSTLNAPDLYCFVNANDVPASSDSYGMIVFKSDGVTKTFDSRIQPLAITGGENVISPIDPTDTAGLPGETSGHPWNYADNDHDFRSSTSYNSYTDTNINTSNTMFACPSLAQAVYKRKMNGFKRSKGTFSSQDHWSTAQWFVMYRGAFRLRANIFDSGWNVYSAGYSFSSQFESGGWGGGGGGGYSSGTVPYPPKTINLQSNAYIIADSSRYD